MGTVALILANIGPAIQLANAGIDIVNRINAGDLTEEEAAAEWQKTRAIFRQGASDWDKAGA